MKYQRGGIAADLLGLVLLLGFLVAIVYGYVMNIVQLVHSTSFTVMVVVRAVAIFVAPVGVILGYIN